MDSIQDSPAKKTPAYVYLMIIEKHISRLVMLPKPGQEDLHQLTCPFCLSDAEESILREVAQVEASREGEYCCPWCEHRWSSK